MSKPDSGRITCKSYTLINSNFLSYTIALSKGTIFAKNDDFLQKSADISKIKMVLVLKGMKLNLGVYLRIKFQVSSIILTIFNRG